MTLRLRLPDFCFGIVTGNSQRPSLWLMVLIVGTINVSSGLLYSQDGAVLESPDATNLPVASLATEPLVMENSLGMRLVPVVAGTFQMGSPPEERWHNKSETLHEVTISTPFFMGEHQVTQTQYENLIGSNPSVELGPNYPVHRVSWEDAVEFCRRLSELPEERSAGRRYRLPTEAEWEYACRAGTTTPFHFGEKPERLRDFAWYTFNSHGKLHSVAQKKPNAWGVYDTCGNLWEWCHDWFDDLCPEAVIDPRGPDCGDGRVIRGGCHLCFPMNLRSASRQKATATSKSSLIGFRVVMTVDEEATEKDTEYSDPPESALPDPTPIFVVVTDPSLAAEIAVRMPGLRVEVLQTHVEEPYEVINARALALRHADYFLVDHSSESLRLAMFRERLQMQGVVAINIRSLPFAHYQIACPTNKLPLVRLANLFTPTQKNVE